jgi:serine carboxypeptidase-like clade 2
MPKLRTGYINVNATFGRNIFYWLFEADNGDPNAPLLFWNTGGPGGSGEFGLDHELGPIKLIANPHGGLPIAVRRTTGAYTKFGALLAVDQPAGVSFSYSTNTNDYALNSDTRSAKDQLTFLLEFLQTVPEYQGRDIWLTGESYAGVYTPMLAHGILTQAPQAVRDSLQGIMIGNPVFRCIDDEIGDDFINFNLLYWHGLVSFQDAKTFWANNCSDASARGGVQSPACDAVLNKISTSQYLGSDFSGDDLYADTCTGNGSLTLTASTGACADNVDSLMNAYYSSPAVVAAIHAKPAQNPSNWAYNQNIGSMLPYYKELIAQNKRILVYSGDVDIQTVPFAYTMPCLDIMPGKGSLQQPWQPYTVNGHTAGHFEVWDAFTYATVRGAGHEVPEYQPLSADHLIGAFITNSSFASLHVPTAATKQRKALKPGDAGFFNQRPSALMQHHRESQAQRRRRNNDE